MGWTTPFLGDSLDCKVLHVGIPPVALLANCLASPSYNSNLYFPLCDSSSSSFWFSLITDSMSLVVYSALEAIVFPQSTQPAFICRLTFNEEVQCQGWSPDGRILIVGTESQLMVYDSLSKFAHVATHNLYYCPCDITITYRNEKYLVAVCGADGAELFCLENESASESKSKSTFRKLNFFPLNPFQIHESRSLCNVLFSDSGKQMAVAALDGHIGIWEIQEIVGTDNGQITLEWNIVFTHLVENDRATSLAWMANDTVLFVGFWDQSIHRFRYDHNQKKWALHPYISEPSSLSAFFPGKIPCSSPGLFLAKSPNGKFLGRTYKKNNLLCIENVMASTSSFFAHVDGEINDSIKGVVSCKDFLIYYTRNQSLKIVVWPPKTILKESEVNSHILLYRNCFGSIWTRINNVNANVNANGNVNENISNDTILEISWLPECQQSSESVEIREKEKKKEKRNANFYNNQADIHCLDMKFLGIDPLSLCDGNSHFFSRYLGGFPSQYLALGPFHVAVAMYSINVFCRKTMSWDPRVISPERKPICMALSFETLLLLDEAHEVSFWELNTMKRKGNSFQLGLMSDLRSVFFQVAFLSPLKYIENEEKEKDQRNQNECEQNRDKFIFVHTSQRHKVVINSWIFEYIDQKQEEEEEKQWKSIHFADLVGLNDIHLGIDNDIKIPILCLEGLLPGNLIFLETEFLVLRIAFPYGTPPDNYEFSINESFSNFKACEKCQNGISKNNQPESFDSNDVDDRFDYNARGLAAKWLLLASGKKPLLINSTKEIVDFRSFCCALIHYPDFRNELANLWTSKSRKK